jgi:hypothetical protein
VKTELHLEASHQEEKKELVLAVSQSQKQNERRSVAQKPKADKARNQ